PDLRVRPRVAAGLDLLRDHERSCARDLFLRRHPRSRAALEAAVPAGRPALARFAAARRPPGGSRNAPRGERLNAVTSASVPPLSVVFFGTPQFAVPSLGRILDDGVAIPLVVTQPDRPVGRHGEPRPSPGAELAASRGIRVEKPGRLRGNTGLVEELRELRPDAGVVVAYGKILPSELLEVPRLGFVNVHASLLPAYRGASPVQAALLAGDLETGVVTMRVVPELDAGPLYLERRL